MTSIPSPLRLILLIGTLAIFSTGALANVRPFVALDRLTVAGTQGFGYDGNGNRVSDSTGTYSYLAGSNRLASSPAGVVSFDAAGNTTAIGSRNFTYNQAGRLATARVGSTAVGTYGYAFDGARTEKTASGVTTLFHYDAGGRLIATTDTFGSAVEEFVLDGDSSRTLDCVRVCFTPMDCIHEAFCT